MKQRKGTKKRKLSAIWSLFLAVTILLGSLPLAGFEVNAAKNDNISKQSKTKEKAASSGFKHPGLLHSQEDLTRVWENVENNVSPNKETWDALWWDTYSNPGWWPRPLEGVTRGGGRDSINQLRIDVRRAYQNALIWKLSGDEAHGEAACRIINAWSSTMKWLGGNADRFLAAGLQGYELANIGELMRDHPNFDTKGLQNLLINVFYPMNQDFMIRHNDAHIGNYWANWELANLASMISIGVYCDREDIYEQALNFFKYGKGNGSFYHTMPYVLDENGKELVQWQESARDQGHTTLGLVLAGVICETAWNQGDDLYGLSDNRFLKAVEYSVKYNSLGEEVPSTYYLRISGNMYNSAGGYNKPKYEDLAGVNPYQRGNWRPIYYQMYNHYVNRKGLEMDSVKQMMDNANGTYIEGGAGNSLDELGWYSLTYANAGERVEDTPIQGELTDGVYRILSASSGKSLVVNGEGNLASAEKGTKKDEWWMIKSTGDGEYTITNMATGKAIQVNGEGTTTKNIANTDFTYSNYYMTGIPIGTGEPDKTRKQRFAFLKDNDGCFRIVPSMTYFVLALEGNSTADDARIVQWWNDSVGQYENYSNAGQRWNFEKATEIGTEFTFDDKSTGFSTTYAEAEGDCTLEAHGTGNAVSLNGTSQFLTLKAKTEKSILAGESAFTVTCEVKPDAGNKNWIFYAAPDGTQADSTKTYLGIKEENGTITAEAYKDGKKSASVSAAGKDGWCQVSVVFNGSELILYLNGQEQQRATGNCSVSDIVGEDSIVQVGKANFGSGEYYQGLLDNLKITGHAMTGGEVIKGAGDYAFEEITVPETLVDFTFDDTEAGFSGGIAAAKGCYSLQDHDGGKALYLNGYKDYLKVTGKDGGSVIPGGLVKEMTISLQAKRDGGDFGWVFYAAQNDTTPTFQWEKYLGVIDGNGTITAQRYYNQGERLPSAEEKTQADRWHYLTIVYTEDSIILYENGEKLVETQNNASLSDILGSDSVWYIGKANWVKGNGEKGEHFRGWIDNYKVVSRAWTAEEIKTEALKYVDKSLLQAAIDNQTSEDKSHYIKGRWETYQSALKTAQDTLKNPESLQSAIDPATEGLEDVQAWMRLDEALFASVLAEKESEYTKKSWKPYGEALAEAKTLQAAGTANRTDVLEAAETLRKTQKALIEKDNTIADAIKRIDAIGKIELTPACSRKVILAKQLCDVLDEEELASVTNLSYLKEAEAAMENYLAEFTFDDEETGFIGGQAVAKDQDTPTIQNGALYLDGTSKNWLNVFKADGSSLLTGRNELTISFGAKPESGVSNWIFYAAPNDTAQEVNHETYLGLVEYQGTFTAERYKNTGERPASASVPEVNTSDWMHVTLVQNADTTTLYINGEKKAEQASSIALPDIFGENSILQIGKANWGGGEYYKGLLDNFKILGTAMTEEEIQKEASDYLDNIVDPDKVADVIEKINAIGDIEVTVASREKIEQAREAYEKLTPAEKALVSNADSLASAEDIYEEMAEEAAAVLAQFTFDDEENGLKSSGAAATANNTPVFVKDADRGNVLSLDGTGNVWLNVTKEDGSSLLTGVEELTVSYYSKAQRPETNWAFYAAPNGNGQNLGAEYYLGIMENGGKVTAERFLNGRQDSAEAAYESGWNHITVVYGAENTKIYVNGVPTSTANNNGSLKQILGENSILQIGKANWGSGEYYQGLLDDFVIYNYAMSERQVQINDGMIADPKELKVKLREAKAIKKDNYTDESYKALQTAIATAKKAYETVTTEEEVTAAIAALQAAIDAMEKIPLDYQALNDKIQEAKAIQKGNYTDKSFEALQTAIASAEETAKTATIQAELAAAVNSLQKAIDALVENGDDTLFLKPLSNKIKEAKAIEQGNYTEESYQALQKAIAAAEEVLKTASFPKEVTEAVEALQKAIDALEENSSGDPNKPDPLDRTPLVDKIKEAEQIEQGNYTDESYQALQDAIEAAEKALDTVTSQEEISAAVEALQDAIDHLEETSGTGRPRNILVKQIKVTPKKKTMKIGQKLTMKITVSPSNATNKAVKITSSNSKIAKVSGKKITAKSPGKATIKVTAKDGSGIKASLTVYVRQKAVTKVKAAQQSTSRYVKVSFGKITGASGYYIYRSTNAKKGYKKIGSTKKTSFIDKKAKTSKTYYYKVVTRGKVSGCNSALSTKYAKVKVLARPVIKVKATKGRKITAFWKQVKGSKGYVVYTSTKKTKGFKAAKTLKSVKTVKATIKAKKGVKKLYVKVRPYYTEKGKKIYGAYSNTVAVKVKK